MVGAEGHICVLGHHPPGPRAEGEDGVGEGKCAEQRVGVEGFPSSQEPSSLGRCVIVSFYSAYLVWSAPFTPASLPGIQLWT